MNQELERIKTIKTFPSLVKYLREELDWRIEDEDIEDLTFEYEPEELGIDKATAVKIKEIKQLRPMVSNQPWGIFYLSFEPKSLPIVALRRILRSLVIKKRESANRSQMATWNQNDLLFISAYGEDSNRELTFAHFSDNSGMGDLPTLKVLGWNSGNTVLRLQDTYQTLKEKLRWVEDETDVEEWRKQWASAFKLEYRETVKTSKELAVRLAAIATVIRARVNEVLRIESEKGELRKLYSAFQEALIHDLDEDDFADMYAQTIAYGLLSARVSRPAGLVADNLADMIPVTNPFLKELMQTFLTVGGRKSKIDFDELGINEVVELLRAANMEEVLRDFGARNPNEDPVIHFYELFLKEYDPEKRMKRGVFYTPRPVVSFIVRSVHEILQKEFGLADGLADTTTWGEIKKRGKDLEIPAGVKETAPFVQILDPATGTGTFLVEVINVIYETLSEKWQRQSKSKAEQTEAWNDYVPKNLLPRLYGFELMMAPYSIAHMKIGLKLSETGYRFLSSERAQIYLTNTLEEPKDFSDYFATMSPALAHEAEAANHVKRQTPITVVVGNPPYANFGMLNKNGWIMNLLETYKAGLNEKKLNLDDDYIKFVRASQKINEDKGIGILAFITNSSYLDGLIHRKMRQSLLNAYNDISIIDLHGSSNRQEQSPDGKKDENVFDIQQGVAIGIYVKSLSKTSSRRHSDIWGSRERKYAQLLSANLDSLDLEALKPDSENSFFVPFSSLGDEEYKSFFPSSKFFTILGSGLNTDRDELCIDFEKEKLESRMRLAFSGTFDNDFRNTYRIESSSSYDIEKRLKNVNFSIDSLQKCIYRPFDIRHIYYQVGFTSRPVAEVQTNLLKPNLGLLFARQSKEPFAVLVTNVLSTHKIVTVYDRTSIAPLYLYPTEKEKAFGATERVPNFSDEFIEEFSNKLGLEFAADGENADAAQDADTFTPEDVFHYAYAVFHSPTYRARYAEFLKIDFPRLPLTTDRELFRKLCAAGANFVRLHLLEAVDAPADWNLKTDGASLFQNTTVAAGFPKKELAEIDAHGKGKVYINKTTRFDGVPETVWNFHIGGYQVCHKWLKDRKDRALSEEDINHYGKIVVALAETIRLMAEIDQTIEDHGGFPFVGSQNDS